MNTKTDTNETITLTTFEAAGFKLRTFMKDGAVWLIGVDAVAGLTLTSRGVAYRRLADDEKCLVCRTHLGLPPGRPMLAVTESGFYKLVLRSDKPEAREFQEWVTREVLPAIRRTGGYRLAGVEPEAVEEGVTAEMPDVGGFTALRSRPSRNMASGSRVRPFDVISPHLAKRSNRPLAVALGRFLITRRTWDRRRSIASVPTFHSGSCWDRYPTTLPVLNGAGGSTEHTQTGIHDGCLSQPTHYPAHRLDHLHAIEGLNGSHRKAHP